jgi:hypothetical protein
MFFDIDKSEVRETIDEQISEFIDEAYYTYPKEYRQSDDYRELSKCQKLQAAIERVGLDRFIEKLTNKIIDYYL